MTTRNGTNGRLICTQRKMVVWASAMPRSAIMWTKSRELNLKLRHHRTHRAMIS
jgi:hypothetical protein